MMMMIYLFLCFIFGSCFLPVNICIASGTLQVYMGVFMVFPQSTHAERYIWWEISLVAFLRTKMKTHRHLGNLPILAMVLFDTGKDGKWNGFMVTQATL